MTRKNTTDVPNGCLITILLGIIIFVVDLVGYFGTVFVIEHRAFFISFSITIAIVLVIGVIAWRVIDYLRSKSAKNGSDYRVINQRPTNSSNINPKTNRTTEEQWNYEYSSYLSRNKSENKTDNKKSKKWSDYNFNTMNGRNFEYFCAKLLRGNGFSNVEITQASNDKGVDIIAWRNDEKYAIQCKCYSNNYVGFKAVQEVFTGKAIYGCTKAMVMTNSKFTEEARNAAQKLGVILLNGYTLSEWLKNTD